MRRFLLLCLIAWPFAEVYVSIQVANVIGAGWTVVALGALSGLGVVVLRGTGRAWRDVMATANPSPGASLPAIGTGAAAANAGFRFLAGLLLLVPGFISGLIGLVLLFPPGRAVAIALMGSWLVRRFPSWRATVTQVRLFDGGVVIQGDVVGDTGDDGPDNGAAGPPQLR